MCSVTGETVPSGPPIVSKFVKFSVLRAQVASDNHRHGWVWDIFGDTFLDFFARKAFLSMPLVQNKVKNVDLHMLSQIKLRFYLISVRKKDFCRSFLAHFWENFERSLLPCHYIYIGRGYFFKPIYNAL